MSDEAFKILSRPRWRPGDLDPQARREVDVMGRVAAFQREHEKARRDPMTHDLVGWDHSLATGSPWPWCSRCKTVVKAYGVENRDTMFPVVWARCHGVKQEIRLEKPSRDILARQPDWIRRQLRYLVFFAR